MGSPAAEVDSIFRGVERLAGVLSDSQRFVFRFR